MWKSGLKIDCAVLPEMEWSSFRAQVCLMELWEQPGLLLQCICKSIDELKWWLKNLQTTETCWKNNLNLQCFYPWMVDKALHVELENIQQWCGVNNNINLERCSTMDHSGGEEMGQHDHWKEDYSICKDALKITFVSLNSYKLYVRSHSSIDNW